MQEPSSILSCLIKKICWTNRVLPQCLLDFYHTYDQDARNPSLEQYEDVFLQLSKSYSEIFLVFDALDECSSSQRAHILEFIIKITNYLSCAKVLVTSRREKDIERVFVRQATPVFEIKAENVSEDINSFVTERVEYLIQENKLEVYDSPLKARIIDTLVTRAEGM